MTSSLPTCHQISRNFLFLSPFPPLLSLQLVQGVTMSTPAVLPFRFLVQSPIFIIT